MVKSYQIIVETTAAQAVDMLSCGKPPHLLHLAELSEETASAKFVTPLFPLDKADACNALEKEIREEFEQVEVKTCHTTMEQRREAWETTFRRSAKIF